ncbi:hypothetical protein Tcan_09662 [Toxocara canis]|uniref:Uncharacterized protein n=2 Tax=Toxocara canis TaxID=6265 RepID=A0A0B2V077_TOXCA|nr:hypothetical protein Tcan_09662 [Toxocara canis]VDM49023.1 unnamed protein product [Toxocara canis]
MFTVTVCDANKRKKFVPPRMHPNLFPEPEFDPNAPECIPLREPCGFYSFSLNGGAPLKWVKSWCQCDKEHECAYERTDMKMRVYRQVCVTRSGEFHDTPQNFYD